MEIALVLGIMVVAVALFASEKFPMDLVGIMILGALLLLGLVTPEEGLSGFANPATVTVASMFILSAGLQKTGCLGAVGRMLIWSGRNRTVLLIVVMLTSGIVSAFINNTAAVAVFLPLVLAACAKHKFSPSKFLIPLSFASEFAGVCTLIGSSTNLLVSSISKGAGYEPFSMFEMGKLGLILCGVGMTYFLIGGRWLLPDRPGEQLTKTYKLGEYITELRVIEGSPIIGKTVTETRFGESHDATVLEILRDERKIWSPHHEPIRAGDVLLVRGQIDGLMELKDSQKLEMEPRFKLEDETLKGGDLTLVQALISTQSKLIGRSLSELNFRRHYNCIVLAIQRNGEVLRSKLSEVRLAFGDSLLLQGPRNEINRLRGDEDFIVLEEVASPSMRKGKIPIALAVIASVVGLAALNVLPIMTSAIIGCVVMVLTRCITLEEAYDAVDWRVIFLLASVIPLGVAMQKSGAAELIAVQSVWLFGGMNPGVILAVFYILTAILTECMSNNASAALLAPIAISTAVEMGVDPKPLLMAVTFAASTSFATPVGYQTNMMIYNPGGYRFTDFMKVGLPLIVLFCITSVYFIPKFWPF